MINYTDLLELLLAFFSFFYLISVATFYYFFKKCEERKSFLKQKFFSESFKNFDKEISDLKEITQNLILTNIDTQEYLIEYKEKFDSLKIDFSKIKEFNTENNKLLNILNRKTNKFIK